MTELILEAIKEDPTVAGVLIALAVAAFMRPLFVAIRTALIRRVDQAWDEAPEELDTPSRQRHVINKVMMQTRAPESVIGPLVRKKASVPPPPDTD